MRKILMIVSALIMLSAMVVGSASTVSAGRPVRTAVAEINSVNASGFYAHWMWDGYGAWGYQLLIYDLDDSAGANYTMPVSWQEKRTTYMASIHYPNPVNYGYAGLPPDPTHRFAIQLTLFKKNGDILEQVSSSWSAPTYTVTFNNTQGLVGVWMRVYTDSEYSNGVGDAFWTNSFGQATKNLLDGTYYYKAVKTGYLQYFGDAFTVAGANLTVSYTLTPTYTVTFNETNGLEGVYIDIYNDEYDFMDEISTNATGQATIDLPNDTYYYYADISGYDEYEGEFTVLGAPLTEDFTMVAVYTVTFNETNGVGSVAIKIYSDPDRTEGVGGLFYTNSSGQGTAFLANGTYYYLAMKTHYEDLLGNFTVLGAALTEDYTMVPGPIFAQNFSGVAEYYLPEGWFAYNTNQIYVYNSSTAGGTAPELYIDYGDDPDTSYDYYVSTRDIDATDTTTVLNLSFKHYMHIYDFNLPFTYSVEVSIDSGLNWIPVLEETPTVAEYPFQNIGPETVTIDLSAYVGNYILICWRLQGYTWHSDGWQIDDVVVDGY